MNNTLYLYNIPLKAWFRWPNVSCASLMVANDGDKRRLYIGSHVGRISKALTDVNYDTTTQDTTKAVVMKIRTGKIYVDGKRYLKKGFKKFALDYVSDTSHTITASITVDNLSPSSSTGENSFSFSTSNTAALLGSSFTLGISTLGGIESSEPIIYGMVGYGKSMVLDIEQSGLNEASRIIGFFVEYENASTKQERASSTE